MMISIICGLAGQIYNILYLKKSEKFRDFNAGKIIKLVYEPLGIDFTRYD